MIRRTLLRAASSLALTSLLALTFTGQSLSAQRTATCESGRTRGTWDLPTSVRNGTVDGVLERNGRPVFRLRGVVLPPTSSRRGGEVQGALTLLTPAGPVPIARVTGRWFLDASGAGSFRLVVFRPRRSGASASLPVQLLGEIRGRFDDPSPTAAGRYGGRWTLCR